MSAPPTAPDGAPGPYPQPGPGGFPPPQAGPAPDPGVPTVVWGPPPGAWEASPPAPSWQAPPPVAPPLPAPLPPPRTGVSPVVVAVVGVLALLLGAVGAGVVATALFVNGAENIGREMAEEMGPRIGTAVGEEVAGSLEDAMGGFMGITEESVSAGPVEEFPAVEPGDLGPDPVLDDYAASCFDGDLGACDDLYYESPPMSDYEEYAGTCGGRVKLLAVMSCTELE